MPNRKALSGVKITDASEGRVQAVFATFNVKDLDGDVTLPGAFDDGAAVRISAYNHTSWGAALPVGKGVISQTQTEAILDGQFFMNTTVGRDTFETVKQMGDLQEWSYGYDVDDSSEGQLDGEAVNFLKKLKTYEVSPVLLGAGIGTRTLAAKSAFKCQCGKPTTPLLGPDGQVKAALCPVCGPVKQLASEIRGLLNEAATARYGTGDQYAYVCDYDTDEGYAIVEVYGNGVDKTLQVPFTRADDGAVVLGSGDREVEPKVTYEPKAAGTAPVKDAPTVEPETEPEAELASGVKLADQLDQVITSVQEVTTRLSDVVTLRAEQGKSLGEDTRASAGHLADTLDASSKTLREVVTSAATPEPADPEGNALTLEDETQLAETMARFGLSL